MEPTLRSGDVVLVDHREKSVARIEEGVYVLRTDDSLLVKRLQLLPGGAFEAHSDNPAYHPFAFTTADIADGQVTIIGRVVWAGHQM